MLFFLLFFNTRGVLSLQNQHHGADIAKPSETLFYLQLFLGSVYHILNLIFLCFEPLLLEVILNLFHGCHFLFVLNCLRAHLREGLHDDGEKQVQQEEGTNDDKHWEIDACYKARGVKVIIHYGSPSFKGNNSENGEDANSDVIKMEITVLDKAPLPELILLKRNLILK